MILALVLVVNLNSVAINQEFHSHQHRMMALLVTGKWIRLDVPNPPKFSIIEHCKNSKLGAIKRKKEASYLFYY